MTRTDIPHRTSLLLVFCLVSLGVGHAMAQSALPSAAQVIANWRTAIHANNPVQNAILVSKSTEDGIPGRITEWITASGRYRRVVDREFDHSELVLGPGLNKRLDWNGFLRDVEGEELKRSQAAESELAVLIFGPPDSMKSATVTRSSEGDGVVLAIDAPGGDPTRWTIDTKTWLPVQSVRPGEDSQITTHYRDWGMLGDIFTARAAEVTETNKPDFKLQRASMDSHPRSLDIHVPAPGPSDAVLAPDAPPIPFTFEASHIVFNVSVNGREPIGFLFDTGADQEVIHEARLAQFGVKIYAKSQTTGGGGTADYGYAKDATFTWPGGKLSNQHVAVLDQTGIERALGVQLGGLLGYDFISRFVVEIDYEKKQIQLHDPAKWAYTGHGVQVPIVFDNGIPFTTGVISVGGKQIPGYFAIDFGAAETMTLTSPFVKAHDLVRLAQTNAAVNRTAGLEHQFFTQQNVRGRIDELKVGELTVDSIPINMSVNTEGAYASATFSGTIGESIFERYHIFIDYPHKRVIFEPTPKTAEPFPTRQTYGLTILASGPDLHTYTVTAVRPGSPAEADTFKKGDAIVAADGASSQQFTLHQLRDKLSHAGEKHIIEVKRGGETLNVPVQVRLVSLEGK